MNKTRSQRKRSATKAARSPNHECKWVRDPDTGEWKMVRMDYESKFRKK